MLTWATQTYGFLTECAHPLSALPPPPPLPRPRPRAPPLRRYISTPKAYADKNNYKYPVGPYQLQKFASGASDYGLADYYEDPRALKLIDQTEWSQDRPQYDIKEQFKGDPAFAVRAATLIYDNVRAQRTANWYRCAQATQTNSNKLPLSPTPATFALSPTRRMVPHVFGWFTMSSVWFILCVQLENAKRDIDEVSDNNIPEWVEAMIYGSLLIFMNFAFVSCSAPNRHPTPSHPPPNHAIPRPDGTTHPTPLLGRRKSSSNVALCHSNPPNQIPVSVPFTLLILVPLLLQASAPACTGVRARAHPTFRPHRSHSSPKAQRARACAYVRVRMCVCVHGSPLPPPAGTEISYCLLSLLAKLYLGWFLLVNVIAVDGTVDEALRGTNEVRR